MNQQNIVFQVSLKSTGIAYLLWLLFGFVGAHKFYLGRPLIGLLYLLTFGFLGVGVIIDLFTMPSQVASANDRLMHESSAFFSANSSRGSSSRGQNGDFSNSFSDFSLRDQQTDLMIDRYKKKLSPAPQSYSAGIRPRPAFGKRNG